MKAVLPVEARRAWLEVFGEPTRDQTWRPEQPSVRGAHYVDAAELRAEMDVEVQQEGEVLLVERGALADVTIGSVVVCGDYRLELTGGPLRVVDDAWEVWNVMSERIA